MATVTCPECGKKLAVSDPNRKFMFCEYCGAKVDLRVNVNVNLNYSKSEHTERIVDEAKVKKAEQQAEEEKRTADAKRERKEKIMRGEYSVKEMIVDFFQSDAAAFFWWIVFSLAVVAAMTAYIDYTSAQREHKEKLDALAYESAAASRLAIGQAAIPGFSPDDDARTFVKNLKERGFVNVTSEAVPDLRSRSSSKEYKIIELVVDGAPDYNEDGWYPVDTNIVVRYHEFSENASEDTIGNRVSEAIKNELDFFLS